MNTYKPVQRSRSFSLIKSLKGKFFVALLTMALLNIALGTIAMFALSSSAENSSQQAEAHLKIMHNGQKLLEHSIMIEHQLHMLLKGKGSEINTSYRKILELLDYINALVTNLGHATSGTAILDLHQINQLFRNSVHIIARLRNEIDDSNLPQEELDKKLQVLNQYQLQLENHLETMIITSNELSSRINFDYRQAVDDLISKARHKQNLLLTFTLVSLIFILIIGLYLRSNTIARLQKISFYLRHQTTDTSATGIPVYGDDEISEMARALEKLLEEHKRLMGTQNTNMTEA